VKIYTKQSVWDAALERIEYLFDEFPNIIVCISGGKDSTVIFNLALIVARKKNRLPLKTYFLDQEAEWGCAIDHVRQTMQREEVEPLWLQTPIFLPNSLSQEKPYFMAWEEGEEWMREKEPNSIGFDEHPLIDPTVEKPLAGYWGRYFIQSMDYLSPDDSACFLVGVRAEESPQRLIGLTSKGTYKHITYGKVLNKSKSHYNFYPLYDWCLSDIWKAIHDNGWKYCSLYDTYHNYGVPPRDMRVSSHIHETAIHSLFLLHEFEKETWEALTKRMGGINQAKHIAKKEVISVGKLPYMFQSWKEYRDYLTKHLIASDAQREKYIKEWQKMDAFYDDMKNPETMYKKQIRSVLVNDTEFTKLAGFLQSPPVIVYRKWKRGDEITGIDDPLATKYIKPEYLNEIRASS